MVFSQQGKVSNELSDKLDQGILQSFFWCIKISSLYDLMFLSSVGASWDNKQSLFFNCSFSETEISSNQQFSLPWAGLFLVGFYISLMTSIDDLLDDLQVTAWLIQETVFQSNFSLLVVIK